jgi:hypothetical protein
LDSRERHKLGAEYTPRSYVERLIRPTIIEPLREECCGLYIVKFVNQRAELVTLLPAA